ncbi:hypothetical protein Tco_1171072 [Tanacetum coccineum]
MNNFLDRKMNVLILVLLSTIVISLKALNESFSIKNYVRKFLRSLHPKWIAKVIAIEETKYLPSLSLDELIGNLKVHEMIMEKESELVRGKREKVTSLTLKAKRREEVDSLGNYMTTRNHSKNIDMIGKGKVSESVLDAEIQSTSSENVQNYVDTINKKPLLGVSWSNNNEENEEKTNDEMCRMAQSSNTVHSNSSYYSDDNSSIDDDTLQNEYNKICELSLKVIKKVFEK